MTPKFKYDPEQHCLREVARPRDTYPPSFKWQRHAEAEYQNHLASLRVIPCVENSVWPEVELIEGVHFEVRMRMWENRTRYAWPIQSQKPRLYTQAEAEEIVKIAVRMAREEGDETYFKYSLLDIQTTIFQNPV